jgi:hypothetical protein
MQRAADVPCPVGWHMRVLRILRVLKACLLHDVGLVASHSDHPNIAVESALFELCCVLLQRLADIRLYTRTDYI